jgi:hypothetical protein
MLLRAFAWASITLVLSVFASTEATAAAQRTFVAPNGSDANPCSIALPCRSFTAAIAQTLSAGEVIVLDSAGYGPVTITQSVSIIAPAGVYAGVSVLSGDGITVNGAAILVTLKGLTITGLGGNDGIVFLQGKRLAIENCTVTGMANFGINVTAASGFTAIADVVASGNGVNGVVVSGDTRASIVRSRADGNAITGFLIADGATVAIRDSEASRNVLAGVRAQTGFAATTTVSIDGFSSMANQDGVDVAAPAPGATTIVDVTRANLSGNSIAGLEMFGPSALGTAIASVTDSLLAGNGGRGAYMDGPGSPKWNLTVGGNRIVNNTTAGLLNVGNLGSLMTRQDNTVSGNTPNTSGTLTPLGGI